MKTFFEINENILTLRLIVSPGGSEDRFLGLYGSPERLKLKIKSQPVSGKANKSALEFVAKAFGVPLGAIELLRGVTSNKKDIAIEISGQDYSEIVRIINNLSK